MTPDQFKRAMVLLFGPAWVSPASEAFGIRTNKLQRMAKGTERIYPDTAVRLLDALRTKNQEIATLLQDLGHPTVTDAPAPTTEEDCPDCRRFGCCNVHLPF